MDFIAIFLDEIRKIAAFYSTEAPLPAGNVSGVMAGSRPGREIPKPADPRTLPKPQAPRKPPWQK